METPRSSNRAYIEIPGKYGDFQNPFLIINVSRNTARSYGYYGTRSDECQEYIIYTTVNGPYDITFEKIYTNQSREETRVRHVWKGEDNVYHSEFKGRREFFIPYFDADKSNTEVAEDVKGESYYIYYAKDFDQELVDRINAHFDKEKLLEDGDGKHKWICRGTIHRCYLHDVLDGTRTTEDVLKHI